MKTERDIERACEDIDLYEKTGTSLKAMNSETLQIESGNNRNETPLQRYLNSQIYPLMEDIHNSFLRKKGSVRGYLKNNQRTT